MGSSKKRVSELAKENQFVGLLKAAPDCACGRQITEVLAFVWHNPPSSSSRSAESLRQSAPLLLNSGAGALAWWRLQHSDLRSTPEAEELHQAYRLHTLQAAIKEREI